MHRFGVTVCAALVIGGALAQSPGRRWVRLTLEGGRVVEGELLEFSARRYRVQGPRGEVALDEGDVRTLEFLDEDPTRGELSPQARLADALARAKQDGRLDVLLGVQHFEVRGWADGFGEPDREEHALLRVRVERGSGGRLVVQSDVLPTQGDPEFLSIDSRAPYRVRAEVDVASGALMRYRIEGAELEFDMAFDGANYAGVARQRKRERQIGAELVVPASAQVIEEQALVFVFAPLLDPGLRERVFLSALAPKDMKNGGRAARLTPLPAVEADAGELRRFELRPLGGDGSPGPERAELSVYASGPRRGRVARLHLEGFMHSDDGRQELVRTTTLEQLGFEAYEEAVRAAGVGYAQGFAAAAPPVARELPGQAALADAVATLRPGVVGFAGEDEEQVYRLAVEGSDARAVRLEERLPGAPALSVHESVREGDGHLREARSDFCREVGRREKRVTHGPAGHVLEREVTEGARGRRAVEQTASWDLPPLALGELLLAAPALPAEARVTLLALGLEQSAVLTRAPVQDGWVVLGGKRVRAFAGADAAVLASWGATELPQFAVWLQGGQTVAWSPGGLEAYEPNETLDAQEQLAFVFAKTLRRVSGEALEALLTDPARVAAAQEQVAWRFEREARYRLYAVHTAQQLFRKSDADGNGRLDYAASLEALERSGRLTPAPEGLGYRLRVVRAQDAPGRRYVVLAEPEGEARGRRWLAMDAAGDVYQSPGPIAVGASAELPTGLERHE